MIDIEQRIYKIVEKYFGATDVNSAQHFEQDLGADRFDKIEVVVDVEEELGVLINDDEVNEIKTVGDLVKKVTFKRTLK